MADEVPDESDERLAARIKGGDGEALRTVLRRHGGKVRGWLGKTYGRVLQDAELDEAFNTAVVKLWRNAAKFNDSQGSLGGWFLCIAQREAITILRRERDYRSSRRELTAEVEQALEPAPATDEADKPSPDVLRRIEALRSVISDLPPKQQAIALADLAAGGSADAGRLSGELNTTMNSVYVLRNKARAAIRKAMTELGHYPETQGNES